MDTVVSEARPRLGAEDQDFFPRPSQAPREKSHHQTLNPVVYVGIGPIPNLFIVLVLRPNADRPLELPLDNISEARLDHQVLIHRRHMERPV